MSVSQKKINKEQKGPSQLNYSEAEDVQLYTSWLKITQDPIIGNIFKEFLIPSEHK
ncbi:hypothetical protein VP01_1014g2 [Puccinia sorghi]|uniref:Uncharacterized protein n=1 Tax=Puccinia sorghi TaxID=27349 RepID=A0A0L6VV67_9BASI|nr:hypothetical protein VP01_1014g2 [Puccinia sorghi]